MKVRGNVLGPPCSTDKTSLIIKVRKRAKIRNRYNKTNGKVTTSQSDVTNESQEVSPFPAGDHRNNINDPQKKHRYGTVSIYFTGRLKPVSRRANLTLSSDADQDT